MIIITRTLSNPLYQYLPPANKAESYAANGLNQYTTVVKNGTPFALSYDANGNLTSDGIWTYSYDVENRLKTAANGSTTATYAYDPLGRRVSKTVNGVATLYLSDGVEEVLEMASFGTIQRRYVFGPGIDEPVVLYQGATLLAGIQHYYRADAQGSIVATTDNNGALRDTFKYGPYGEPSNPAGQPIQFTGRRWDPETGLYFYRARYYSPALGRFLQTDPVGYGDNTNLYSYVANDPINVSDPTGLKGCPDIDTVGGAKFECFDGDISLSNSESVVNDELRDNIIIVENGNSITVNINLEFSRTSEISEGEADLTVQAAQTAWNKTLTLNGKTISLVSNFSLNKTGGFNFNGVDLSPRSNPEFKLNEGFGNPLGDVTIRRCNDCTGNMQARGGGRFIDLRSGVAYGPHASRIIGHEVGHIFGLTHRTSGLMGFNVNAILVSEEAEILLKLYSRRK